MLILIRGRHTIYMINYFVHHAAGDTRNAISDIHKTKDGFNISLIWVRKGALRIKRITVFCNF